jgi:hypothetical protein
VEFDEADIMTSIERTLLESLDALLHSKEVRSTVDRIVEATIQKLSGHGQSMMAWEAIPLTAYGGGLPPEIKSSWVFVLRAGATTGAERHPNSCQRMMSYRGRGDLQTGGEGCWQSHPLVSDQHALLEQRWIAIPENVWHQAVVADRDWVVVSFHTAAEQELIEERPRGDDPSHTTQQTYVTAGQASDRRRIDFQANCPLR